jgi:carbon storage regulator CsrA
MLILNRRSHETVCIQVGDELVRVTVWRLRGSQVKLAFHASPRVAIDREEIYQMKQLEKKQAT